MFHKKDPKPVFVPVIKVLLPAKRVPEIQRCYSFKDMEKEQGKVDYLLDLRGTKCPLNYVKVKVKLEDLDAGQLIEIILDDGEPIRNVPMTLKLDGHEIVQQEKIDEKHWKIIVKKKQRENEK